METIGLVGGVVVLLAAATAGVGVLRRRSDLGIDPAIVDTFSRRVRAWWYLCTILAAAILGGDFATVMLFGLISFWALREFITLTPTRTGDHRTLVCVFFLFTPLQFVLVWLNWYGAYSIAIPVYAFLIIPPLIALSGDFKRFLERTAKIQAGLLICVYCLSHAPALMQLPALTQPPATAGESQGESAAAAQAAPAEPAPADATATLKARFQEQTERLGKRVDGLVGVRLLVFFILIVQLSDALQYAWAHIPVRHVIVPTINPTRTWEGLLGGTASVALVGAALWWATPFPYWLASLMSAVIALMGFAGALTMSAIKRDRGVKDYGTLVEGHGGVLDRIDSMCFAAPVFFHLTRLYLLSGG